MLWPFLTFPGVIAIDSLLDSYKKTLKMVNSAKLTADELDRKLLSNAASGIKFCITWMETGRYPEYLTPISKLSYEKRTVLYDPEWLTRFKFTRIKAPEAPRELQELVDDLLSSLTQKEREAVLLVKGNGLSYGDVAELMGYKSRGAIQAMVQRGLEKMRKVLLNPGKKEGYYSLKSIQKIMGM